MIATGILTRDAVIVRALAQHISALLTVARFLCSHDGVAGDIYSPRILHWLAKALPCRRHRTRMFGF